MQLLVGRQLQILVCGGLFKCWSGVGYVSDLDPRAGFHAFSRRLWGAQALLCKGFRAFFDSVSVMEVCRG